MIDSRWQQIEVLFLEAADLAPVARDAYLHQVCGDDVDLRGEVNGLLAAESRAEEAIGHVVSCVAHEFGDAVVMSRLGERVGAYRLVEILGQGGMGTVYLADRADDAYRGRVAIKFVRGAHAVPELAHRFLAERQILADLNHPGIARLLDGGATVDGTPYLVLEYVEGVPIDTWCDTQRLDVQERVDLLLKVCESVQYAHDSRVVHRDLKPSNILVTAEGTPKLVDFGIAKLVTESAGPNTVTALQVLTPAYASPEQVRGESVTFASDVYSLGVVAYQLLAGRLPFDLSKASAGEVERQVCLDVPPLVSRAARDHDLAWRRDLRGELDAIASRALEKRADRRHPSVAAFAADLRSWRVAPPHRRRLRSLTHSAKRHRLGLAAATLLAIAGTTTALRAAALRRDAAIAFRFLPSQAVDPGVRAPFRVVSADVNGDGRADLVWNHLDDSTNQVAVGLAQVNGTFVMQQTVNHPSRPAEGWHRSIQLVVGDFNADGRHDLLWSRVGETLNNVVFAALSNADGSFRFTEPFRLGHPTLRWATGWRALVGDLDGDGTDDLAFNYLDRDNLVRTFRSRRDGTFDEIVVITHYAKGWRGYRAFLGDVDGDRRDDLVWNDVPVWANRSYVARSLGNSLDLRSQQDHGVTRNWSEFETNLTDVDGDGRDDMVWTDARGDTLELFTALGRTTLLFDFLPSRRFALPGVVRLTSPVIGDFNGDGRTDFVWPLRGTSDLVALRTSGSGRLLVERAAGYDSASTGQVDGALIMLPMDVNADDRDDLVFINTDQGRLYVAVAARPRS